MTEGINLKMSASGAQAVAGDIGKVTGALDKATVAEHKLAAAASKRGQAQHGANRGAHGAHSGIGHSLHLSGLLGGEVGHLGHMGARAARFGGTGLAFAGVGLAFNAALEAAKEAGEKAGQLTEHMQEFAKRLREAGKVAGEAGLGYAEAHGGALQRLYSSGRTDAEIHKRQAQGFSPESQADMLGKPNEDLAYETAEASRKFGSSPSDTLSRIAKDGGLREGQDKFSTAAYYSGSAQGRIIGEGEIANARRSTGGGDRLDQIEGFAGRTMAANFDNIGNGRAGSAGADKMNKAISPEAYATSEAFREAMEKTAVLQSIDKNTNLMAQGLQFVLNKAGLGEAPAAAKLAEHNEQTTVVFGAK